MADRRRRALRALLPLALLLASGAASAAPRHLYCVLVDLGEQAYWFSGVFEDEGGKTSELAEKHREFIATQATVSEKYQTFCFAEATAEAARRERLAKLEDAIDTVFAIHGSGWPEP